jgi:hypothetical protein
MSWRINVKCVHSDVIRALDAQMPEALKQGANPDLFHAASRAAAAIATHVGRGPQHGGVDITISGHAGEITNFSVVGWDVKAAGAAADKDRAAAEAREAAKEAKKGRRKSEAAAGAETENTTGTGEPEE